jgi:hypothetical protein
MLTAFFRFIYSAIVRDGVDESGTLEAQAAKKAPNQRVRDPERERQKKR